MDSLIIGNWGQLLRKMPSLLLGLFIFALCVVANLYSGLGMSPWGVFPYGIARNIPLTFGQVSQIVGLAVLFLG